MKAVQYDLGGVTTAVEALDKSQSAWNAELAPMYAKVLDGFTLIPDHKIVIRSDNKNPIGVVGDRYTPLQNSFAYSWFDTICAQHNAAYNKCYVIDGGHKIILEASVNGPITIRKGDEPFRQIRLINTFDGSYPFTAQFSVWRMICKNGMMGWSSENKVRVHHTKNGEVHASEALRILAAGMAYFTKFEEQCKVLANKILDKEMVEVFLTKCFGKEGGTRQKNLRNKVVELYEAGKGTGQGTAYDLYNGYIEWIDHFRSADAETRLANAVLGANPLKEAAFDAITSLVK